MRPLPPGLPPGVAQHAINFQQSLQQPQSRLFPPGGHDAAVPLQPPRRPRDATAAALILRLVLGAVAWVVGMAFFLWLLV